MIYGSWKININRQIFCHLGPFLLFYGCNSPKNENIKKIKKTPGDIIILHQCTKNHNHKLYCFWDMAHGRCNVCYFSFWTIFCCFTPLPPLTAQKMKISKQKKMPGDIIILHNCTKNCDYSLYCSWDMTCDRCNCYFSFWAILSPFTP